MAFANSRNWPYMQLMELKRKRQVASIGKLTGIMDEESKKTEIDPGFIKPLPEAAKRALAEAAERRKLAEQNQNENKREINGRGGLDPCRYGDWEKKGIAVDF